LTTPGGEAKDTRQKPASGSAGYWKRGASRFAVEKSKELDVVSEYLPPRTTSFVKPSFRG